MRPAPRLVPHQGMREFVRLTAEAIGVGLAASVLLLLAAFAIATHAEAASLETPPTGTLRLKGPEGFVDAPLVATTSRSTWRAWSPARGSRNAS